IYQACSALKILSSCKIPPFSYLFCFLFKKIEYACDRIKNLDGTSQENLNTLESLDKTLKFSSKDQIISNCSIIIDRMEETYVGKKSKRTELFEKIKENIFDTLQIYLKNQKLCYSEICFGSIIYMLNKLLSPKHDLFQEIDSYVDKNEKSSDFIDQHIMRVKSIDNDSSYKNIIQKSRMIELQEIFNYEIEDSESECQRKIQEKSIETFELIQNIYDNRNSIILGIIVEIFTYYSELNLKNYSDFNLKILREITQECYDLLSIFSRKQNESLELKRLIALCLEETSKGIFNQKAFEYLKELVKNLNNNISSAVYDSNFLETETSDFTSVERISTVKKDYIREVIIDMFSSKLWKFIVRNFYKRLNLKILFGFDLSCICKTVTETFFIALGENRAIFEQKNSIKIK
ncbi:MAG: hypothetical protein MHMPM18_004738, partial [Marteilia pararefringens]